MGESVFIWDVTLRDGEQTPGLAFTIDEKVEIASFLSDIGVTAADVSFPSNSKQEQEATKKILSEHLNMSINVTAMMRISEVDFNYDLGVREINMMAPMSNIHIEKKFGTTKNDIRWRIREVFDYAFKKGMRINFVGEDASRADLDFALDTFKQAFDLGADKIVICDTVGVMEPHRMSDFVHYIVSHSDPRAKFAIHCHNDFGLATANTLAAVDGGVQYVTVSVNGLGERAGNAPFEEVVLALEKLKDKHTGIQLKQLFQLSKLVERISGIPIAITKPVVGHNIARHESGIHVAAMLKDPMTYESFEPEDIGRQREFVLGKHSGKNQVKELLADSGVEFTPAQVEAINLRIKEYMLNPLHCNKHKVLDTVSQYNQSNFGLPLDVFWEITGETIPRIRASKHF